MVRVDDDAFDVKIKKLPTFKRGIVRVDDDAFDAVCATARLCALKVDSSQHHIYRVKVQDVLAAQHTQPLYGIN
jgi:hypothetical protein